MFFYAMVICVAKIGFLKQLEKIKRFNAFKGLVGLRSFYMSCCPGGYCKFNFPDGPPLIDNAVSNLNAQYQFLPYGTLLEQGETVRIWMENGQAKTVFIEEKIPLEFLDSGPVALNSSQNRTFPWQLIAFDSGFEYADLVGWKQHDLYSPTETAVLLKYNHPIEVKPSLKMVLLKWLYKIRNL